MCTKIHLRLLFAFLALVSIATAVACGSDDEGPPPLVQNVYLVGQVYDGAEGTRLTSYSITVKYRDVVLDGTIGADGRFLVPSLPVFQDYTVEIKAGGFRVFRSHNAGFNIPNPNNTTSPTQSSTQTFYYDAYLFPTALTAPALSITVRKDTSMGEVASGKARLRPISASALSDTANETPRAWAASSGPMTKISKPSPST